MAKLEHERKVKRYGQFYYGADAEAMSSDLFAVSFYKEEFANPELEPFELPSEDEYEESSDESESGRSKRRPVSRRKIEKEKKEVDLTLPKE